MMFFTTDISPTSGFTLLSSIYCTPFFHRCQHIFYNFPYFFEIFFNKSSDYPQNSPPKAPKGSKHRSQPFANGQFPAEATDDHPAVIPPAQIPPAHAKAQVGPCPEQCRQKENIPQSAGSDGTQKPIVSPKANSQGAGYPKPL
jgi:hypothetical protein